MANRQLNTVWSSAGFDSTRWSCAGFLRYRNQAERRRPGAIL